MAGWFRSARERRLWVAAGVWLLLVYASLYPVRPVATWLRERNLLRLTVAVLFLLVALYLVRWMARLGAGRGEWAVAAGAALVYLAVMWPIELPEERVHLIQYGVLGGLVYAALLERRRPGGPLRWSWRPALAALAITTAAGWADEGIQHLLPNRYYGWRDVGLNALAGALAIASLAALGRVRRSRRTALAGGPGAGE